MKWSFNNNKFANCWNTWGIAWSTFCPSNDFLNQFNLAS